MKSNVKPVDKITNVIVGLVIIGAGATSPAKAKGIMVSCVSQRLQPLVALKSFLF
jgi:hypothetical protein